MSAEPDKDSFSLRRHRGGEGGLDDVLGASGLLVGSPEKKRRKSSTQAFSFSPLSEYAPPPNPSSDHLIASNPFDDIYSLPSVKSLPLANSYFGPSHYSGFRGYGTPSMVPHMGNRMSSHSLYHMRNQPHPFSQNPMGMGFNRAAGFNYRHPENPNYGHSMGQPFRTRPGENVNPQNQHHSNGPDGVPRFGPDGNAVPSSVKTTPDMSPKLSQQHNNFNRSGTPKQGDNISKNTTQNPYLRNQSQNCEDGAAHDGTAKLKAKGRGNTPAAVDGGMKKLNGVPHSNTEPRPENTQTEKARRGSNNKVESRSNRRSASSEPVYPCGICLSEVNDDQEAILCEASCQKWFHRVCTGMTETAYNLLTAETSAVWGCDACMDDDRAQLLKTRDAPGTPSVSSDRRP